MTSSYQSTAFSDGLLGAQNLQRDFGAGLAAQGLRFAGQKKGLESLLAAQRNTSGGGWGNILKSVTGVASAFGPGLFGKGIGGLSKADYGAYSGGFNMGKDLAGMF
jgi:hypothetical protein